MHRNRTALVGLVAALAFLPGCMENPASPGDPPDAHTDEEEELTVELAYSPDHVHILQTEVTFTVTVTDHHGEAVTDFEAIQVERLAEGSDTWRGVDLELAGDAYEGVYVFASSGDYRLRVSGQRHGQAEAQVLYEAHDPMHAARAHGELGEYRVEFESFPGHIHEGETATLRFWLMEAEKDAAGNRAPIPGLDLQIHCHDELHDPIEPEPGTYEAEHTFVEAGESHVGMHLMEHGGHGEEAEFTLHIAGGH